VNSNLVVHTEYYVDSLEYYLDRFGAVWNLDDCVPMAEEGNVVVGCHYSKHYVPVRDVIQMSPKHKNFC